VHAVVRHQQGTRLLDDGSRRRGLVRLAGCHALDARHPAVGVVLDSGRVGLLVGSVGADGKGRGQGGVSRGV
jgi:hypothetical protein